MPQPDPHSVGRLWLEEGSPGNGRTARVAPIAPLYKTYSYAIPPELVDQVSVGQRVQVPLGKRGRLVPGFCVALDQDKWTHTLRPINALIDDESYLSASLLELGEWMARYYCCPLGTTLAALVPQAVRQKSGFKTIRFARLVRPIGEIIAEAKRIGPKAKSLLDVLEEAGEPIEAAMLLSKAETTAGTLRAAAAKGWVEIATERRANPPPGWDVPRVEPDYQLSAAQADALRSVTAKIDSGGFGVTLLFGVSGSGKTEVYIRAMRHAMTSGGQAIMLVPEIALTTQLVNRLASRFDDVAVIHSGLTGVERSLTWRAIARGDKRVVIGTRSAVFAPCPHPALIVVDEEQEPSYKNLQAPRFHVRDVAIKRAQACGISILLGSATPSLETWHNCTRLPHYERIDLPTRVRELPMPSVRVVDMRRRPQPGKEPPVLSRELIEHMSAALARAEQAVVLINRRGFANMIWCPACQWRLRCPQCNVGMVFHSSRQQAACHYCRARVPVPSVCPNPSCRGTVSRSGAGTQRIEQELGAAFPTARIVRADSDTMKRGVDYQNLVTRFAEREIDILLGTQMIAKGLDFPDVSFVGVIGADLTGSAADFRSSERLFQLLTQVAGRAGRERVGGEVVVQTLVPDAVAIQTAVRHDYEGFASEEIDIRRRIGYPPFSRLVRFVFADAREACVHEAAQAYADQLSSWTTDATLAADVIGPTPCALERLRGQYRYDLLLRSASAATMQRVLDHIYTGGMSRPRVKSFMLDVDPLSLT